MEIRLIRHGKTAANEQKLYCGATDLPLSDNGIKELVEFKKQSIYAEHADLYCTSGLKRADQTLDLLYGSVNRTVLPNLAEFKFGNFEMKSHESLKDQDDYKEWITDETGLVSCPGGENRHGFTRRVIDEYELLAENLLRETAFIVCHGGVISCIMEHLFPNARNFYEWQPRPGRGYIISRAPDGLKLYKTI